MDSTNNIYRSFVTLKEMLADQKQDISLLNSISNEELEIIHRQSDNIFQIFANDHLKIIYYLNTKFKFADLKKYIQSKDNEKVTDIIIIFKEKINSFNPKNIEEFNNINLQTFVIKELLLSEQLWLTTLDTTERVLGVIPKTSSVQYKTTLNDKLINYTIDFDFAFDTINTIR